MENTERVEMIYNDYKAEKYLEAIKELTEEKNRIVTLANQKITDLKEQIEYIENQHKIKVKYYEDYLEQFLLFAANKKTTTTQEKYKLLSGEIVRKLPVKELNADKVLLLKDERFKDFVKTTEVKDFAWGEFKKTLKIVEEKTTDENDTPIINYKIVDANGEILENVPGLTITEKPAEFIIKLEGIK
jgi:hypothetical protein